MFSLFFDGSAFILPHFTIWILISFQLQIVPIYICAHEVVFGSVFPFPFIGETHNHLCTLSKFREEMLRWWGQIWLRRL